MMLSLLVINFFILSSLIIGDLHISCMHITTNQTLWLHLNQFRRSVQRENLVLPTGGETSLSSLEDMEMASFHDQHIINSFDGTFGGELFYLKPFVAEIFPSFSAPNSSSLPIDQTHYTSMDGLVKQFNSTNWSSHAEAKVCQRASSAFSSSQLISFGESDTQKLFEGMVCDRPRSMTRSHLQAQDHIVAERKRREKLNELFISLSKIVPGLKKLDKASLLGDAIKYMKELQERVRTLEEEAKGSSSELDTTETRSIIPIGDDDFSFLKDNSTRNTTIEEPISEIKVRISHQNMLIKIQCEKHNGVISRIQTEMEKLHLTILYIRAIPFGCSTLDISIHAEIGSEFSSTVYDITKHLQRAILSLHKMKQVNF